RENAEPRRVGDGGGGRSAPPRRLEDTMTTEQKIIRAKIGLLALANQLGNVSQASKMMGYRPRQLLSFQGALRQRRRAALQEISRKKPVLKNRVPQDIEDAIV